MRKISRVQWFIVAAGLVSAGPAFATGGGMGDPSTHIREMNALCDAQRRGQAPPNPNMCLPEYPLAPVARDRHDRG